MVLSIFILSLAACKSDKKATDKDQAYYAEMKAKVLNEGDERYQEDHSLGEDAFDPNSKEATQKLIELGSQYTLDSTMQVHFDMRTAEELDGKEPQDSLIINDEVFIRNMHTVTLAELKGFRHNLDEVAEVKKDSISDGNCSGMDCAVYAHVSKKDQRLYLFINGTPVDTFKTSTGKAGHLTPDFNRKPNGRMFKKYTSHKFPGGNYDGLGNMPYAVFIEGGYAIHGTTVGSWPKLGTPASHGCIRLHPKNGKIFYNLVKYAGSENTWIVVDDN